MKFLSATAHNIKVQAHCTWLCARDPALHWALRLFALLIAGYALSPIDLIPDFIPLIGLLDDAIVIPLGIWLFRKFVSAEIYARNLKKAELAGTRPVSKTAAVAIVILWILVALWLGWLLGVPHYF